MQATPDPRHWWHLSFIEPLFGVMKIMFITEAPSVEVAIARAELAGARPPGCHLSAEPFRATAVHLDWLDIPLTVADFAAMPVPVDFQPGP